MKTQKYLLPWFIRTLYFEGELGAGGDVPSVNSPSDGMLANAALGDSSSSTPETSEQVVGNVQASEGQADTTEQPSIDDILKGLPPSEQLQTEIQNKVPYAQAVEQLRNALAAQKAENESLQPLASWKPHIEKIGDPEQLQTYQQAFAGIHQPVIDPNTNKPTGEYTSRGTLQVLEKEYPGFTDEAFKDMLTLRVDIDGKTDTVERHFWRHRGLNPDRWDEYKEIDKRVPGIVSDAELQAIPEAYRAAYKQLPQSLRGVWSELDDQEKQYHLNTSKAALDAQEIRQQIESEKQQAQQAQERQFEAQVQQKQEQSLVTQTQTLYGRIKTELAGKVTFSAADPALNGSQLTGVMSKLYCLIDPAASFLMEDELKDAGITLDFKDATWQQTIESFSSEDSKAVLLQERGRIGEAREARTKANGLLARIASRLDSVGLTLAQRASGHVVTKSAGNGTSNGTRQTPNGNGFPQGNSNAFLDNPHTIGTPEYRAWNRDLERQLVGTAPNR